MAEDKTKFTLKDYIYSIFDSMKLAARNLSVKLDAIRENQDAILAIRDSGTKAFENNQELGKSINATLDSMKNYSTDDITSIGDVAGLKKVVADLKETKKLATKAAKEALAHKKELEELAKKSRETVEKIDKDEKEKFAEALNKFADEQKDSIEQLEESDDTISSLDGLQKNTDRIVKEAELKIQELELEDKDEVADVKSDKNPQDAVATCENNPICDLTLVKISDKAGRKLNFDLANPPAPAQTDESGKTVKPPAKPKVLFVIVGDKEVEGKDYNTEQITINSEGSCKSGSACPQLSFTGAGINKNEVSVISKIDIKSEKVVTENSWADFLRKIFVPDMAVLSKPQVYEVKAHQCDAKDKVADLKVVAIPPVGWKGNAKIGYKLKTDEEKAKITEENKNKGIIDAKPLGEWEFSGQIDAYLDKKEQTFKPPEEFLKVLQDGMNKLTPMFSEIQNDYADITVAWPNVSLEGNVDLVEHPSSHQLNYAGKIELKAEPLFQVNCDVDIKAIIIRLLAKEANFSKFILEIMGKLEAGVGNDLVKIKGDIQILLKTEAEISGNLLWERKEDEGAWQVDAAKSTIGGSVGIELHGAINVEGKAFCVRGAAGASINVRSFDGKDKSRLGVRWAALEGANNPALERSFYFNGLAVYYSAFSEIGTDDTEAGGITNTIARWFGFGKEKEEPKAEEVKPARGGRDGKDAQADSESDEKILAQAGSKELQELCKLMNEWKSDNAVAELGKDEL